MGTIKEEQDLRTAKAIEGLEDGTMTIANNGPSSWIVQNGDHSPHPVKLTGDTWTCDCFDFQHKGNSLRCKHIEAVIAKVQNSEKPKEKIMENTENVNNNLVGYVEVYHPAGDGILCRLPIPMDSALSSQQAKNFFENINQLLRVGFLGKQPGELKDRVTHIARRARFNKSDRTVTPIIDIYTGGMFKMVYTYLNKPEDVQEFERIFGLKLDNIPLWEGDNAIQREKDPAKDAKYVIPVNTPIYVRFKENPKWTGEDDKQHPRRVFVSWVTGDAEDAEPENDSTDATENPQAKKEDAQELPPYKKAMEMGGFGIHKARKYQDGTVCSPNAREIAAFDNFVKDRGKPPYSVKDLRAAYSQRA